MPGGRPRKYASKDAYNDAQAARMRIWRLQKQQRHVGPTEFIPYEPPIPHAQIVETRSELNLRVSPEIGVLLDPRTRQEPSHEDVVEAIIHPTDSLNLGDDDATFEAEIQAAAVNAQVNAQDDQDEQEAYEAAIQNRMSEIQPEVLIEADPTAATAPERTNADRSGRPSGNVRISPDTEVRSVRTAASTSITPKVARAASVSSQSSTRSKQRHKSFPPQTNTLLSWVQTTPQQASVASNNSLVATARSPSSPVCLTSAEGHTSDESIVDYNEQHEQDGLSTDRQEALTPLQAAAASPAPSAQQVRAESVAPEDTQQRTAYKLARQLRHFQGCSYEQHAEADRSHEAHHQEEDVNSTCSSLQQITRLIRGEGEGKTPLPDALGDPKMMKPTNLPANVDLRGAFEGVIQGAESELPASLCLSQHHSTSPKGRAAGSTFDIDSLCCFPSSLGIARKGINWFPRSHSFLNFAADVHFSLTVQAYSARDELTTQHVPLHTVPHYCFGTLIGMESVFIYVFFPSLRLKSQYKESTFLSTQDQELWYDAVLIPSLTEVVASSNVLQHLPVSAHVAKLDATALATESFAKKESSREQLLKYALQPQHLDPIWTRIQEKIAENPGFARFSDVTLFMHAKNTKLEHMDSNLSSAYTRWQQCWDQAVDAQFYSKDRTFVDVGKQVTSEDSALPYDAIPSDHEAEVYLWRQCCLKAYADRRVQLLADGKRARGSPRVTTYPWATMRDTVGQTLFAVPHGQESIDGLVYSQFYGLIKTPFDTSKTYVFYHDALENLALDPGYIRSLCQQGGGAAFSPKVCEAAYLHSKKRAHANLVDNQWKSYGIREEHR